MESHRILAKFNLEIRGFYNYYCIADNVSATCSKLGYIMQYSLYKTLAQKLNSTMPKIVRKYRKDKEFKIEYTDKKGNQKYRVLYNGGFAQKQPNKMADCDNLPHVSFPKRSLAERLRSEICELCGRHDKLIMHLQDSVWPAGIPFQCLVHMDHRGFMMSAAVPWIGAFIAALSPKERTL